MLNHTENRDFSSEIETSPFSVAIRGHNHCKLHFFNQIVNEKEEYKLHFCNQPLSKVFPLVISSYFSPILPLILLRKTTNWSILKKAIDESFSFQWILVSFRVLLTRVPVIYLEQFIGPTNSSRQVCPKMRKLKL